MSGGYEGDIETREIVKEVMNNYGVERRRLLELLLTATFSR